MPRWCTSCDAPPHAPAPCHHPTPPPRVREQVLLAEYEDASRILVRLSLFIHAPIVLFYMLREWRRECGFEPELLSLPFLRHRLTMLYEAVEQQIGDVKDFAAADAPASDYSSALRGGAAP